MQPRQLGPYRLIDALGAGGMGEVYLAEDTRLGRKVAIKVLPPEFAADRERISRFSQEARAAAALSHPHIAAVYDVGADDGTHYMVQEYLQGRPLRDALAAGPLARTRALTLAAEIAEGLAAAHAAGIVHRDLKPDNVFVSPEGHAKILDFGLAKLTEVSVASPSGPGGSTRSPTMMHTVAGAVMGTAGYVAPEQVAGREVDRRADLFALGCVLYEMLVGQRAFEGETLIDTLHAISRQEPAELRAGSRLDGDLRWLLQKCLAKERAARYQHADDLAIDLRRLASAAGPVAAGDETLGTVPSVSSRLPWTTAAAALMVAAAAVFWPRASTAPEVVRLAGTPVPLMDGVLDYVVSASGTLVYRSGSNDSTRRMVRMTRDGVATTVVEANERYSRPQLSPDGSRIAAVGESGGILDIWDAVRGVRRRLVDGAEYSQWAPDGESLVYMQAMEGAYELRRTRIESTEAPEILYAQEISMWPTDVSPDGTQLLYYEINPQTERDIWVFPLDGSGTPQPYLVTPASERSAVFSPDGRWVAYMSDVTGSEEVYVRPAPGLPGNETIITAAGGREPRWSPDGSEIYFRRGDGLWAVPVATQTQFSVGTAEPLFRGNFHSEEGGRNQQYDVFPNGDFLMTVTPETNDELRIVVNWFEELKRLPEER